jgi:hypothetical protein
MNADGSNIQRLAHVADDYNPMWSPDGNKILFAAYGPTSGLYTVNPDGSGLVAVGPNGLYAEPSWSPDSASIAFGQEFAGNHDVYKINADGTGLTRLTTDTSADFGPSFKPDGRILFVSNRTGNDDLFVMNGDGTNVQQLTTDAASDIEPYVQLGSLPVNNAPMAINDIYTLSRKQGRVLNVSAAGVLANDSDSDGDSLTATLVSAPARGTLTFNSDGSFAFRPSTMRRATYRFTYVLSDGKTTSEPATVTIEVHHKASENSENRRGKS